ncbi:CCA tRNA nucleotidyltransferase [Lichenicola sp.]|uniref:CCA tRNA nucleotidyltransferase n=1 Tax=Lichenicola sp. TaxID=2804529 RepID=UPI003B00CD44
MIIELKPALAGLPEHGALQLLWSILPDARLVGGAVRDLLADRPTADLDMATALPPDETQARLHERGIKVVPTGLAHGTVTAVIDRRPYEITTLRRDLETDGRHAIVAWTDDWQEDAARRDFTINAMSLGRDGVLHDYFGGAADLAAGRVRFVGEADRRIAEDALRVLRFFRFQARYGRGAPDDQAVQAIAAAVLQLSRLSAERVWSELRRLLELPDPLEVLGLMQRLGVLPALLPESRDQGLARITALVALGGPVDPVLRLAALGGPADRVAARLRLSNQEAGRLATLASGVRPDPMLDADALRRLLADEPAQALADRTWLVQADRGDTGEGDAAAWTMLRERLHAMPRPVFPLSGRDAVAAGLPPGPAVGLMLREVEAWWREGGCLAGRADCLERLARLRR